MTLKTHEIKLFFTNAGPLVSDLALISRKESKISMYSSKSLFVDSMKNELPPV